MEKILSSEELDALLSDLEGDDAEEEQFNAVTPLITDTIDGSAAGTKPEGHKGDDAIKLYDFKRPERFSSLQLRTLEMIHDNFARLFSASISTQLRTVAEIQVISVLQQTYREFVNSLPTSTCINIFTMSPLEGRCILEIHADLVFIIIDRLFGGSGGIELENREFTDIEVSMIGRVVKHALNSLNESWRHVVPIETYLEVMESNPQFAQVVLPNEMVVAITFEVRIEDSSSTMTIGIPYMTLKAILPKLSMEQWLSRSAHKTRNDDKGILRKRLERVKVPVKVNLCHSKIKVKDVLNLKEGDVIRFYDSKITDTAEMLVGKRHKFVGQPINSGKKRGIRVLGKAKMEEI